MMTSNNKLKNKLNDKNIYSHIVASGNTLQSCSDYLSGKCDDIHNQAYNIALEKFLEEHREYKDEYTIIEIKDKNWKKAPNIILMSNRFPFQKSHVSLEDYWDMSFIESTSSSWENMCFDEDSIKDAEIISVNYASGTVVMESRFTGNKFTVPFSKINENTKVNDDKCTLSKTFISSNI